MVEYIIWCLHSQYPVLLTIGSSQQTATHRPRFYIRLIILFHKLSAKTADSTLKPFLNFTAQHSTPLCPTFTDGPTLSCQVPAQNRPHCC